MVEKITIFEPHIEGGQFGPTVTNTDDSEAEEAADEEASGSRAGRIARLAILGLIAMLAIRAVRGRRDADDEVISLKKATNVVPSVR